MIPNAKTAKEGSRRVERGKKGSPIYVAGSLEVVRSQRRKEGRRSAGKGCGKHSCRITVLLGSHPQPVGNTIKS